MLTVATSTLLIYCAVLATITPIMAIKATPGALSNNGSSLKFIRIHFGLPVYGTNSKSNVPYYNNLINELISSDTTDTSTTSTSRLPSNSDHNQEGTENSEIKFIRIHFGRKLDESNNKSSAPDSRYGGYKETPVLTYRGLPFYNISNRPSERELTG
ncbi:unnamed protein product [Gongylonema pulchrum]|uniref:Secreted protein n=1 Tax=Gongylonema pulchrum TaxID=637853 RepID=A0A183DS07_9BILA|nr:unnamed protein product [Gongylonema pulchrum]